MPSKRLHLTISQAQYKELLKLSEKLGMDLSNTIRHCIAIALTAQQPQEQKPRPEGEPT